MATINHFSQLDAWKKSHELRLQILQLLPDFPQTYQFGLCAQLQRSAISVSSNIAEGFGRKSDKEKSHFLNIAEGSLTEVQDQMILCRDLTLLDTNKFTKMYALSEDVHKLIHGLLRYIRNTNSKLRDTKA